MNIKSNQRYQILERVNAFGDAHAKDFPSSSIGGRMFAIVGKCAGDVARHALARGSRPRQVRDAATSKAGSREALRKLLVGIATTARALAMDHDGFDTKFRLPRGNGDQRLLAVSREFALHARERAGEFVALGLPPGFLDELADGISLFERVIRDRAERRAARIGAGAGLERSLEAGFVAVRRLDAIVQNVFRDAPATLKAWRAARRAPQTRRRGIRTPQSRRQQDSKLTGRRSVRRPQR